ncbi:MAG: hypothetical protein A2785_02170 [Candidatus Chisholmbacteria bacterium RIFCSPHIGHO2_01_FULL_49_18]|uniref:Uncharacterized protein n=2 Tax=Candidatus Chisholmiibacteriota TaxID=1817900 RepID=A0A1G1VNE4_9BACT|nr:MAG: hypothetical protein A2785_02170 [Candidatus Chisholmbacteria bacterium RIFCSPHIGHO2_01_FULL_49_18]OGY21526.1 MAG: hypothetical protein A3A65_05380 [Candidatus Chisholmbacteria bacterium RIFCSPLOWO2_01_FULL_49_14]
MEKAIQRLAGIAGGLAGLIFGVIISMSLRVEASASPPLLWHGLLIGLSVTLTCVGVGFGVDFIAPLTQALIRRVAKDHHATETAIQEENPQKVTNNTHPQPQSSLD